MTMKKITFQNGSSIETIEQDVTRGKRGNMIAWIHDDITWCGEEHCPVVDCMRNQVNRIDKTGMYSMAMFRGTDVCPVSRDMDQCIDGCAYAKEAFASHHDPQEAMIALQNQHCDDCIFAEVGED